MKYVLVDRYLELEKGRYGRAVKTITHGEDFLEYHLSPMACLPASLLIEVQAQTAGILVSATYDFRGKALLAKVERAEFYRPLVVGDRLFIEARVRETRGPTCGLDTQVEVNGAVVARMSSLYTVLSLASEEGRLFDVPKFYIKRAELMRALGVLDLLGLDQEALVRAGGRGLAAGPPASDRSGGREAGANHGPAVGVEDGAAADER